VATLWGFFIHANLRWRFGWLEWLISTPGFHHWHHTNDEHVNKNFASMLPCMDKLFGTWYMPGKWPTKYGTDTPVAPGLPVQLLQPFLPDRKASVPTAAFGSTSATTGSRGAVEIQ
jgi:sterol desaturase/sphingolipid hydroxylase (fatty acid hydroxylase superfamily)